MLPVHTSFPFFEPNQVLSNEHLNQLFAYLDEQERLTRTNLIGIGIVCGLELSFPEAENHIRISKGCGVTSEGYLITWPDPGPLRYFKAYNAPENVRYDTFLDDHDGDPNTPAQQYPLWILSTDHNNDPDKRPLTKNFMLGTGTPPGEEDEKVVVLFLECRAADNKNCSPNSCDDKGLEITATVVPLLIRRRDMDAIQDKVRALGTAATEYLDMAATTAARFTLPELRLPRYDVPATALVNTSDIFDAYQAILTQPLTDSVADALSEAYAAFQPMLAGSFAADPFSNLKNNWTYLHDGGITAQGKYLWFQYYYDYISDVIQAYNEFRERGLELLGLCCPDSRLFPRHLMLGLARAGAADGAYRHHFMPSPLFSRLQGSFQELMLLFRRLVEITAGPELPPLVGGQVQAPIRITPSRLGPFSLSDKAIPYYYQPAPLYQFWDYRKNRQGKERQNLGYRAPAWNFTEDFVLNPLRYDLEPNNFLRIEGHLGHPYTEVIQDLLEQRSRERLPIEIVAVKTGRNSGNIPLPGDIEGCHFQDLEALYDALREELTCHLCESVRFFYDIPLAETGTAAPPPVTLHEPQLPLLKNCAPHYRYRSGTVGQLYEAQLNQLQAFAYPDLNQLSPNPLAGVASLWVFLIPALGQHTNYIFHLIFIYYQVKLSETLPADLDQLDFDDFENKHQDLVALVRQFINVYHAALHTPNANLTLPAYIVQEDMLDHLENIPMFCKLEPIASVHAEYLRRLQRLRDLLLFSSYVRQNPGIQHKAGVPLAGTFIVVYHGDDQSRDTTLRTGRFLLVGRVRAGLQSLPGVTVMVVGTNFPTGTATDLQGEFRMFVHQLPVQLRVSMPGYNTMERLVVTENTFLDFDLLEPGGAPEEDRFPNLFPGQVVADFFLPYLCCSDCQPVQFVLPKIPPTFTWVQQGCTTPPPLTHVAPASGQIVVTPQGGVAPYQVSVDGGQTWVDLPAGPFTVANQSIVIIRDAELNQSAPRTILLNPPLRVTVAQAEPPCNADGSQHRTILTISGGLPPYTVDGNLLPTGQTTYEAEFPSGSGGTVVVQDSTGDCQQEVQIVPFECPSPCDLPCGGRTLDCGYLMWLQPPPNDINPFREVALAVVKFQVTGETSAGGPVAVREFKPAELSILSDLLKPDLSTIASLGHFNTAWAGKIAPASSFLQSVLTDTFPASPFPVMQWSYDPQTLQNGPAVLRIERFECHKFEIVIRVSYIDRFGFWTRITTYTENGTTIQVLDANGKIAGQSSLPPFDCILRDYCNPDNPPANLCKEPREFKIEVLKQSGLTLDITLVPTPAASDRVHWEFLGGQPAIRSGANAQTSFPVPGQYRATVLVVGKDTCLWSGSIDLDFSDFRGGDNTGGGPPRPGGGRRAASSEKSVATRKTRSKAKSDETPSPRTKTRKTSPPAPGRRKAEDEPSKPGPKKRGRKLK